MDEYLIYRFPGESVQYFLGRWEKTTLQNVLHQTGRFVVSTDDGKEVFAFVSEVQIEREGFHPQLKNKSDQIAVSQEDYSIALAEVLKEMEGDIQKTVFSRIDRRHWDATGILEVFDALEEAYPNTLVYILVSGQWGTWLGATPETLLACSADHFNSMALAGTLPANTTEDWTEKEREEQAYVEKYILEAIQEEGSLLQQSEVEERFAGPVKHLCTRFQFVLKDGRLEPFIRRLHPTPAVCGIPLEEARALYRKYEKHQRKLYTGFIGRVGREKFNLFVNLRCMECYIDSVDLYVGGGITKDSVPGKEWEETVRKANTLGQFLSKHER